MLVVVFLFANVRSRSIEAGGAELQLAGSGWCDCPARQNARYTSAKASAQAAETLRGQNGWTFREDGTASRAAVFLIAMLGAANICCEKIIRCENES
jgi:hypothetical protein